MIERHYFNDKLLKSYEFNFGFIIPNSQNSMEQIYELPNLDENQSLLFLLVFNLYFPILNFKIKLFLVSEIIANPNMTKSDTFYFVDNVLIMHHKAEYSYVGS
jgi:hypothetical protein